MELKDILAISGKGGLFKFVSQGRNGIIVESFEDQKRTAVSSSAKVSALEDIAVFTDTEEVPLAEVFEKLYAHLEGKPAIGPKSSPDELKALMEAILPEYDRDRVYVSDMKKLVQWYNQLLALDLLKPGTKESGKEKTEEPATDEAKDESKPKAAKKPAAKKPAGETKKPASKPKK